MPTALQSKSLELSQRQKELADIFEEAGPDYDLSKVKKIDGTTGQKAAEIRRRNDEMATLGKERDELAEVEQIARSVKERGDREGRPAGGLIHGDPSDSRNTPQTRASDRKSVGQMFVESKAFTGYNPADKRSPSVELDLKGAQGWFGEQKTLLDTTGFVPETMRGSTPFGPIVPGALRRPVVADLLPQGDTSQIAVVYMEETTTTNAAAAVAEGGTKPESALAFTERSSSVRKIATVLPVTDEMFADAPFMRSYVEQRLRLFLQLAEETMLLTGNGTPPNLTGLLNVAGIQTQAKGADPVPDAVYKAMTKLQTVAFLDPSGVIFHPNDWQDIRLLRTADGIYIWGSPSEAGPERIWGQNIVKTPAMTENTALVGAFDMSTMLVRRSEVTFAVSTEHSDFFITNKLMLRVEERVALPVFRPTGLCTVTGI